MTLIDGISFGITIGLGLLSLGVSILSIVLAIYFAKESNIAFDKIKELTNEIKALTNKTYENQRKYSDKMLDTIIGQSKFGTSDRNENSKIEDEALKNIIEIVKKEIEGSIHTKLKEDTNSYKFTPQLREDISKSIEKTEIDFNIIKQKFELPNDIKKFLEDLKNYPAHYILLRGILLSGSKSISELQKHEKEYCIPEGWERGPIDKFLANGILKGTLDKFYIPEELIQPLYYWIDRNKEAFDKLINIYERKPHTGLTEEEKEISLNEIRI